MAIRENYEGVPEGVVGCLYQIAIFLSIKNLHGLQVLNFSEKNAKVTCGSIDGERNREAEERREIYTATDGRVHHNKNGGTGGSASDDEEFQDQTKILYEVSRAFRTGCGMPKDRWRLCDSLGEMLIGNNILYSKAADKLGYSDGFSVGKEQKPEGRTLSLGDMTNLIAVYDCVLRLKEILLGEFLRGVYNIIEHTATAEIILFGEDEAFEWVTEILGRKATPEERAKELLELQ